MVSFCTMVALALPESKRAGVKYNYSTTVAFTYLSICSLSGITLNPVEPGYSETQRRVVSGHQTQCDKDSLLQQWECRLFYFLCEHETQVSDGSKLKSKHNP